MSKLGVTPQNYTIEVPGYAGKINLRRISLKELTEVRKHEEDREKQCVMLVALAALDQNGNRPYSTDNLEEVSSDLPSELILAISDSVASNCLGKRTEGN